MTIDRLVQDNLKPSVGGKGRWSGREGSQLKNIVYCDRPGLVVRWADGLLM